MTPNNIVNMAMLNGLSVIALSDHNTVGNVSSVLSVAKRAGLIALPAMELETAEEIHVLCLFRTLEDALRFEREAVAPALPDIKNRVDIFGKQQLLDDMDEEIGQDDRYLINATEISIDSLPFLLPRYNGLAIPAHIDKQTKSLMSVFGMVDKSMGFTTFELSRNLPADFFETHPEMNEPEYRFLYDSDAHYLQDIAENNGKNYLELEELTLDNLWDKLSKTAK